MEKLLTQKLVKSWFSKNSEISLRTINIANKVVNVFYIDCLVNKQLLSQTIIAPLINLKNINENQLSNKLFSHETENAYNKQKIVSSILNGAAVVFLENSKKAISVSIAGYSTRSITEPPTSQVTKGPREGFVEDLQTNISMIRRRLKSPNLAIESMTIGKETQTKIAVVYLENIADIKLAKNIKEKLNNVQIDGIIDSYYVETILEEGKLKFLRRIGNSEKADVVASRLLEGRIAVLVDGSPIVLTLPFLLVEDLQSPEDYYQIAVRTSFVRIIRLIGLIISVLLPGLYVSLQSYQYKILPINFLVTLLSTIQGISLPPLLEILFVLFLFDILQEASARMPKLLGMALSIIGALVLGEATIQAGIISPPSIVIVAISSIMLFIIPDDVPQTSLFRLLFTFIGGIAGFYGMLMSFVMVSTYILSADGYGVPILAPYAPTIKQDKQDAIIKKSLLKIKRRPKSLLNKNKTRLSSRSQNE